MTRLRGGLRAGAVAGLLLLAGLLEATGVPEQVEEAAVPSITIAVDAIPQRVHPRDPGNEAPPMLLHALYDGLLRLNAEGEPAAQLAASWEHSGDGSIYTIVLREDVLFHDGTVLDSALVRDNLADLFSGPATPPLAPEVSDIRALDDRTVQVVFSEPYAGFPRDLSATEALIVSGPPEAPVGTGAFLREDRDEGAAVDLVAAEGRWAGPAGVDRIRLRAVAGATARTAALIDGRVDLIVDPPPSELEFLRVRSDLRVHSGSVRLLWAAAANLRNGVLTERELREAVSRAVDRSGMVRGLLPGIGAPATLPVSRAHPALRHPELRAPTRDPRRSEQILRAAGALDAPLRIGVPAGGPEDLALQLAEALRVDLAAVGFAAELRELSPAELTALFESGLNEGIELMLLPLDGIRPLSELASMLHSDAPPGSHNIGGFNNQRVDSLIEDARGTADGDERRALTHAIQEVVMQEYPWIMLVEQEQTVAAGRGISGVELHPVAGLVLEGLGRD